MEYSGLSRDEIKERVRQFIDEHENINFQDITGKTLMDHACITGNTDLYDILIEFGYTEHPTYILHNVTVNNQSYIIYDPIFFAFEFDNLNVIKKYKGSLNVVLNLYFDTGLSVAVKKGYCDIIEYLMTRKDVNFNYKNNCRQNIMFEAVMSNNIDIVDLLLKSDSIVKNLEDIDIYGKNVLFYVKSKDILNKLVFYTSKFTIVDYFNNNIITNAFDNNYPIEYIKYLIKIVRNIDTNVKNNKGMTALLYAINTNDIELIKMLIEYGEDPNYEWKSTPLIQALTNKNKDVVKFLLSLETVDTNATGSGIISPLVLAIEWGDLEIIEMLLSLNANPNYLSSSLDNSILYTSVLKGNIEIVKLLLKHNANPNLMKTPFAISPLILAIESNLFEDKIELVESLLKHGANPNLPCGIGMTKYPLLSAKETDIRLVGILLKYGASFSLLNRYQLILSK